MDQTQLLMEYLKEQYAQARQHETRQTNTTTFLTAASGIVLGLAFKHGAPDQSTWWVGLVIMAIGAANIWINRAYHFGNRFHTRVAGETRRALEEAIATWTVKRPSQIRQIVISEKGLAQKDDSIGKRTYAALNIVPIGVMFVGLLVATLPWLGFIKSV